MEEDEIVAVMDMSLYVAAMKGDKSCFNVADQDDYFLRKTSEKNNIIHVSLHYDRFDFTKEAAIRLPQLISEINCDGNNPLHIAVKTGNTDDVKVLVDLYRQYCDSDQQRDANHLQIVDVKPWRAKNKEGNTPLHVALVTGKIEVARYLVDLDPGLASFSNKFDETPLHLAVRYRVNEDPQLVADAMKLVANKQGTGFITTFHRLEKDSMPVVELLLQKDPSVACCRDTNGLTPLLIAATLNPPYLQAIETILHHCPASADVYDRSGKTFLHVMSEIPDFVDFAKLLRFPATKALTNVQDNAGNTPLHIAINNHNINMILILLKCSANLAIKNKGSVSAADLIRQQSEDFRSHLKAQAKEMESHRDELGLQQSQLEMEEMKWSLKNKIEELGNYLFPRKSQFHNILHTLFDQKPKIIAEQVEFEEFMRRALEKSPSLICQVDGNGYNPLHLMVLRAPILLNKGLLDMVKHYFQKVQQEAPIEELCYDPPWKAKDRYGNTILHLALKDYGLPYIRCAREILDFDSDLAIEANTQGEIPLDLLSRVTYKVLKSFAPDGSYMDDVKYIIEKSSHAVNKADAYGLTPLLRAAKENDLHFLSLLLKQRRHEYDDGDSLNVRDPDGNTYCHLLANMGMISEDDEKLLGEMSDIISRTVDEPNKDGNTAIHTAVIYSNFQLAQIFFDSIPLLVDVPTPMKELYVANNEGNTVLHLMVKRSRHSQFAHEFVYKVYSVTPERLFVANNDGNTPLHLAVIENDYEFANIIFDTIQSQERPLTHRRPDTYNSKASGKRILSIGDKDGNTPLHLAILNGNSEFANLFIGKSESFECIEDILRTSNVEGNTPLHLAILRDDIHFVATVLNRFKSMEKSVTPILATKDKDHNTPLHLAIVSKEKSEVAKMFIDSVEEEDMETILQTRNKEENTPLHLALEKRDFDLAENFIKRGIDVSCIAKILDMHNSKHQTPGGIIGSEKYLPPKFEKFFWKKPEVVKAMLGVRSLSGVSTQMIKEYTNTMGVTAALMATITFTAAFTVPGGLDTTHGTPLLMAKIAFQVFMVSDILAMCLSMMVLFCLLWIMTIGDRKHQVVLLDLTVFLLELAFYATLLTFMMGLYVTVFPVTRWIAILSCILCSLLILLMHKRFIISIIPGFILIYVWLQTIYSPIRESCGNILCFWRTNHQNNQEGSKDSSQAHEQAEGQVQTVVDVDTNDETL